jgi:hypothetical protein
MAPRHAVVVAALAMLMLLCGPDLVSCLIGCAVDPILQARRERQTSSAIVLGHTGRLSQPVGGLRQVQRAC